MIAPRNLVDWGAAFRTLGNTRVHIMDEDLSASGDLASGLVHRIPALKAGFKAT